MDNRTQNAFMSSKKTVTRKVKEKGEYKRLEAGESNSTKQELKINTRVLKSTIKTR